MSLAWHLAFLRNLLTHKLFVIQEGRKLRVPWPQLLAHDLSKLTAAEYRASVRFEQTDRPLTVDEQAESRLVLKLHRQRNPHHPEHWLRASDNGELRPLPMPDRYRREMLADWRAVSRAKRTATRDWYIERFDPSLLHPETRAWVEHQLGVRQAQRDP